MAISHAIASGMGGMRAAGDLVARMQMTRGMKIDAAKAYVANKLKISVSDLTDPVIMMEIREDMHYTMRIRKYTNYYEKFVNKDSLAQRKKRVLPLRPKD